MNNTFPNIFQDERYLECIRLAMNSKSDSERYGSLVVKKDTIIGKGYNKKVNPKEKDPRIKNMGYANHAEINAINDAIINNHEVKHSDIYVAGLLFIDKQWRLFIKTEPTFTCTRCSALLLNYGINNIIVPTITGWQSLNSQEAYTSAQHYKYKKNKTYEMSLFDEIMNDKSVNEKRRDIIEGEYTLDDIAELL